MPCDLCGVWLVGFEWVHLFVLFFFISLKVGWFFGAGGVCVCVLWGFLIGFVFFLFHSLILLYDYDEKSLFHRVKAISVAARLFEHLLVRLTRKLKTVLP